MVKTSSWLSYYQVLPDGRYRISAPRLASLTEGAKDRIVKAVLKSKPSLALLLDMPFQVGMKAPEAGSTAFYLTRIRLRDLEGWPPRIAPYSEQPHFPGALRCALKSTEFREEGYCGRECVEFELECQGRNFKAWQVDCPVPLLRCVNATLRQDGAIGKKLVDLQEMRLICPQ